MKACQLADDHQKTIGIMKGTPKGSGKNANVQIVQKSTASFPLERNTNFSSSGLYMGIVLPRKKNRNKQMDI